MPFMDRLLAQAHAGRSKATLAAVAGWSLALLAGGWVQAVVDELPPAQEVVDRILERAAYVAQDVDGCLYTYEQRTLTEELNADGHVVKSTEKTYRVELIQGLPFSRLIQIGGKDLSPAELKKENRREEEFRRKLTATDFESMARRKETWITRELMDRYDYTVQAREVTQEGRSLLVLHFAPRASAKVEHSVQERILGRLAGRLWVDEEEAEVAKIEVRLVEGFSLGFLGILGSVEACDVELERRPISDGCWANSRHHFHLVGRKLFSAMRVRSIAQSSGFTRTPSATSLEHYDADLGEAVDDCTTDPVGWGRKVDSIRVDPQSSLAQNTGGIPINPDYP